MKHIFSLLALFMAGVFMTGCTDELAVTGTSTTTGAFTPKGEVVDAYLELTVSNLSVSASTRDAGIDTEDTEAERQVDNIWVFQYDNDLKTSDEERTLISTPQYITIEEQPILQNVPVKLSDNDGKPSIVYVVTNTNSDSWGAPNANYTGFNTLADLKQQALPTREPIWETDYDLSIPMGGSNGEDEELIVENEKVVTVPVQRMYAKVMIDVQINLDGAYIYNVGVGNIPQYCRVESLSDDISDSQQATYPDDIKWISRTFENKEEGDESTVYTVYVPENLQGEQDLSDSNSKDDPSGKALAVNVALSYTDEQGGTMQYPYTAYPGKDILADYNIKRNVIYYITMNISVLSEARVPSANSFAVIPGETLAFYPYYREEKGGGYNFENYLKPSPSEGDKGQQIKSVAIVWQTPDCIGDNSDGSLVWLYPNEQEHNGYEKIYVKIDKDNKDGNALIAAYNGENGTGDIIWSWHIWVTENDPTNEANALTYYTYDWDENGIQTDHRSAGYQIMNCNLGALHDTPEDDDDLPNTYGMLYQWGRKDPFPPLTQHGYTTGGGYWAHDYTEETTQVLYGNDNKTKVLKTADTDETGTYLFHSIIGNEHDNDEGGIRYSIENPTVFMCGTEKAKQSIEEGNSLTYVQTLSNYHNKGAWSDDDHDNKLWGGLDVTTNDIESYGLGIYYRNENNEENTDPENEIHIYKNYGTEKSIFDPCPYGWRVASSDLWLGFSNTGSNPTSMDDVNYDKGNSSAEGLYMFLEGWQSGRTSFFPCQGFRVADGCGYRVSACGNYSNANTDANDRVNIIHIHNNAQYFKIFEPQTGYTVKSTGNPVRCVRDKE